MNARGLGATFLLASLLCGGCMSERWEEFVPVQISLDEAGLFSQHPEYWEDESFSVGLLLVLREYGCDFQFIDGKIFVRSATEQWPLESPEDARQLEMESRSSLTTKAFAAGKAYMKGLK